MSALKKYYRKPSLYINLPSGLNFYPEGFFSEDELSTIKEVGILPMTTMNELMLKNPEALLNGSAIIELIKDSTTLHQVDIKKLVKADIDALLVAIKIASQGDTQELDLKCPKCKHEATYTRDLKQILTSIKTHESEYFIEPENIDDMRIYLRPSTYEDSMILDSHSFDEQKKITQLQKKLSELASTKEIEEEDQIKFMSAVHEIFRDITVCTMEIYANCIEKVVVGDEVESDSKEIYEWLKQIDSKTFTAIKNKLHEINSLGLESLETIQCVECEHKWQHPLDTNPTDFFVTGS